MITLPTEQVSFPRGVNDTTKWRDRKLIYKKGTPIHVRGTLLYNHYVKDKNLDKKYTLIQNGEKIKFCYLNKPNPSQHNVISVMHGLPKEFDLSGYIDYDTQFNKAFLDPLKIIVESVGWSDERKSTLEGFFG